MAEYLGKNFSNRSLAFVQAGDSFQLCNLAQRKKQFLPVITADRCNLLNCEPAQGSTVIECNTGQVDLCCWLHPTYGLPVEPEDCRHVVSRNDVKKGGVVEITEYIREDTTLPKWESI